MLNKLILLFLCSSSVFAMQNDEDNRLLELSKGNKKAREEADRFLTQNAQHIKNAELVNKFSADCKQARIEAEQESLRGFALVEQAIKQSDQERGQRAIQIKMLDDAKDADELDALLEQMCANNLSK